MVSPDLAPTCALRQGLAAAPGPDVAQAPYSDPERLPAKLGRTETVVANDCDITYIGHIETGFQP